MFMQQHGIELRLSLEKVNDSLNQLAQHPRTTHCAPALHIFSIFQLNPFQLTDIVSNTAKAVYSLQPALLYLPASNCSS